MSAVVAVLGLGEAGSRYAADLLAAGVTVAGYDPASSQERPGPPGLRLAGSAAEAVSGARVVLSLNAASAAEQAARVAIGGLLEGTVFADLNTASPRSKRRVAAVLDGTGALFADVAVLARCPGPACGLRWHSPGLAGRNWPVSSARSGCRSKMPGRTATSPRRARTWPLRISLAVAACRRALSLPTQACDERRQFMSSDTASSDTAPSRS
jgi:hypothetical protein